MHTSCPFASLSLHNILQILPEKKQIKKTTKLTFKLKIELSRFAGYNNMKDLIRKIIVLNKKTTIKFQLKTAEETSEIHMKQHPGDTSRIMKLVDQVRGQKLGPIQPIFKGTDT